MPTDISSLGSTPDLMLVDRKARQRNLYFLNADHGEIAQGGAVHSTRPLWSIYGTGIGNQWLSPDWGAEFFQVIVFLSSSPQPLLC